MVWNSRGHIPFLRAALIPFSGTQLARMCFYPQGRETWDMGQGRFWWLLSAMVKLGPEEGAHPVWVP